MSLALFFLGALLLGLTTFLVIPFIANQLQNLIRLTGYKAEFATNLTNTYRRMALNAYGRALLVCRDNAGNVVRKSTYNPTASLEEITIGGKKKQYKDSSNAMGRLEGQPFGIVHESCPNILTPEDAHMSEKLSQKESQGTRQRRDVTPNGEPAAWGIATFGPDRELVDLEYLRRITHGDADPRIGVKTRHYVDLAFKPFDSARVFDYMMWIFAACVGFGLKALATRISQDGGGDSVSVIPIQALGDLALRLNGVIG